MALVACACGLVAHARESHRLALAAVRPVSAGALVAPVLLLIGIPKEKTGAIIAMGAIMGMAAPPINIPALLIAGGVDMPYIGFEGPLFFITVPCAVIAVLILGLKHCKGLDIEKLKAEGLK